MSMLAELPEGWTNPDPSRFMPLSEWRDRGLLEGYTVGPGNKYDREACHESECDACGYRGDLRYLPFRNEQSQSYMPLCGCPRCGLYVDF